MMDTLMLDPESWDLVLNLSGNIQVATGPYAQAQDAASQIRLFQGELWYDNAQGIPYWSEILGEVPPVTLMKGKFVQAALLVPGTAEARCFITSLDDRIVTGTVQIVNDAGQFASVNF